VPLIDCLQLNFSLNSLQQTLFPNFLLKVLFFFFFFCSQLFEFLYVFAFCTSVCWMETFPLLRHILFCLDEAKYMQDTNQLFLMLFSRVHDKSPMYTFYFINKTKQSKTLNRLIVISIRARALSLLASLIEEITSEHQAFSIVSEYLSQFDGFLLNKPNRTRTRTKNKTNKSKTKGKNEKTNKKLGGFAPQLNILLELQRRSTDEKSAVRKASLSLVRAILFFVLNSSCPSLRQGTFKGTKELNGLLTILAERSSDPIVTIRKQSLEVLTETLKSFPAFDPIWRFLFLFLILFFRFLLRLLIILLFRKWKEVVFPSVTDRENSIQDYVAESANEVLVNFTK